MAATVVQIRRIAPRLEFRELRDDAIPVDYHCERQSTPRVFWIASPRLQ
jgi:hypothetical protein